ncbi:MAG: PAS domain S-box protein [Archaeoglobus sp.]|nr:PAS domain S-box protein [Archaeoglobus sp.]
MKELPLEMLKDLAENTEDIVFSLNQEKKFVYVNRKWKEVFGFRDDEIEKLTIYDILPPDDTTCEEVFRQVTQGKEIRIENVFITKNGRKIEVEGHVIGKKEDGKFKGCLGIFRDITQRKELERRLKESEEKFRTIAEESLPGIFVIQDGKFKYINKIVQIATGYSLEELMQIEPFSLVTDEFRDKAMEAYEKALNGKKVNLEVKYRTKDGRKRWVLMSVTRIIYDSRPAVLGNWYDITKLKELEEKLRKSEEEYRNLVENALIGVYKTTIDGRIIFANQALIEMLGHSKEETFRLDPRDLYVKKEDRDRLIEILKKDGRVVGFETELITNSGNVIEVLISAVLDGEYISGMIMDITERKKMEERLVDLNEKLRLLNKILRHDLSNDISAILGAIEVFKATKDESFLEDAIKAGERSIQLINDMRELESVITTGKLRSINLRDVIEEIRKSYDIEIGIEGGCKVLADDAITSVLNNLIKNAVIHSGSDRIDIKLKKLNGFCEMRVVDYGKGIPEEIKEHIFKEGFKYGKTGHTGLGLYIVKSVVEKYGGEVWVENNEPSGSIFVVKLKCSE